MLDDSSTLPIDDATDDDTGLPYYDRDAQPSSSLSAFNGEQSQGTWTLYICDAFPSLDDGAYNRARLALESPAEGPDLSASKTVDTLKVARGMAMTYVVTIANSGLADAVGVTLTDAIPDGTSYVPGSLVTTGSPPATIAGRVISWSGTVGSGQEIVVTFQVTVDASSGFVTNTAVVDHISLPDALEPMVISQVFGGQQYLYTNEMDLVIPDDQCATMSTSPIAVGESFSAHSVQVGLTVDTIYRGDISGTLRSPLGTVVQLIDSDIDDDRDNYDVRLDDASTNPLNDGNSDDTGIPFYDRTAAPSGQLASFAGEPALGTWTLSLCDLWEEDIATLRQWSLFFFPPPPEAPTVSISASGGSDVQLTWPPVTEDVEGYPIAVDHYEVWRSKQPYFAPGDISSPLPIATPAANTFTDSSVLHSSIQYYYVVKAVSASMQASAISNRVGKHTFTMVPGGSP
jgi:uncharacterized repeat protein (TIGR01451 family)